MITTKGILPYILLIIYNEKHRVLWIGLVPLLCSGINQSIYTSLYSIITKLNHEIQAREQSVDFWDAKTNFIMQANPL
jgi:hypothetical protein